MKVLVVVDMQNDFVDGSLGTKEAVEIVDNVVEEINKYKEDGQCVIYTRDTHYENYLESQEGKNLPVVHCIKDTEGWQLAPKVDATVGNSLVIDKPTFGSPVLGEVIRNMNNVEEVELIGLCTDICVISNALLVKAFNPELPVKVKGSCCAGVSVETHNNALASMKVCQIEVL